MFQFRALVLAACAVAALRADVTMRYKTNVKLNPSLPAAMTQQATKGMQNALPPEMVVQWKQGKGASAFGPFQSIVDVKKQQITLIDPGKKRVATATSQEILDEFAKAITELTENKTLSPGVAVDITVPPYGIKVYAVDL